MEVTLEREYVVASLYANRHKPHNGAQRRTHKRRSTIGTKKQQKQETMLSKARGEGEGGGELTANFRWDLLQPRCLLPKLVAG